MLLSAFLLTPFLMQAQGAASADLSVDAVRQAILKLRSLIQAEPKNYGAHISLAYVLMDAGMAEEAKREVALAVAADPKSSFAFNAQGWVLEHNAIGVQFGHGYPMEASLASYRHAVELNPEDLDAREGLANALEYDQEGLKYAPDAHLAEAVELYRFVLSHSKQPNPGASDNLLFDLFYLGRYEEILQGTDKTVATPARDAVFVAARAAFTNSRQAVAWADEIRLDPAHRSKTLETAAEGLWNKQMYAQAADLLQASLADETNTGTTLRKIQLFRTLKPFQEEAAEAEDPVQPVKHLFVPLLSGAMTGSEITDLISTHSFTNEIERQKTIGDLQKISGLARNLSKETGLPLLVVRDVVFGMVKFVLEPGSTPGYRILVQIPGRPPQRIFVANEDGANKVVAFWSDDASIGRAVLYRLRNGKEAEAEALLNWKRRGMSYRDGEDPLSGALAARFWTVGESHGAAAMELEATALTLKGSSEQIAKIEDLYAQAIPGEAKTNLALLLTRLYLQAKDGPKARQRANALLAEDPDSPTAMTLAGQAMGLEKDWAAWKAMLQVRLAKSPNDAVLLHQSVTEAEEEEDFSRARAGLRVLMESGQAVASDYNLYAWLALFEPKIGNDSLAAAGQANAMSQQASYSVLHTNACVNAALGKTMEARQYLIQAMEAGRVDAPDAGIWLGFGLIFEQYGERDAAIRAYQSVEVQPAATDSYALAQRRLKVLRPL